jgi:hypothetical protein
MIPTLLFLIFTKNDIKKRMRLNKKGIQNKIIKFYYVYYRIYQK